MNAIHTDNAPARLFSESSAAKCPRMTKLFSKSSGSTDSASFSIETG